MNDLYIIPLKALIFKVLELKILSFDYKHIDLNLFSTFYV